MALTTIKNPINHIVHRLLLVTIFVSIFFMTSIAKAIETKKGDILLFGKEACKNSLDCSPTKYIEQSYLAFFQQVGKVIGVYQSLFGEIETLDLTPFPYPYKSYYWYHVEISISDNQTINLKEDEIVLILRLKQENPQFIVDIEAMIGKFQEFLKTFGGYNQPFIGAIKSFVQWDRENGGWMSQSFLEEKWKDAYGVSLSLHTKIVAVQYSPTIGSVSHTDILNPVFWQRDANCSTIVTWSFVWGWYKGVGKYFTYDLFLDNISNVNAVDALTPGQVGWFLVNNDLVNLVGIIRNSE